MTDVVNFKHSVELHVKENKLINDVTELISKIPNLDKLKLDPQLTVYVCNVIENVITKHDTKTLKKSDICKQILTNIFNLQENEISAIEKQIIFLSNNKAIKKIKLSKKIISSIGNWVTRKIL